MKGTYIPNLHIIECWFTTKQYKKSFRRQQRRGKNQKLLDFLKTDDAKVSSLIFLSNILNLSILFKTLGREIIAQNVRSNRLCRFLEKVKSGRVRHSFCSDIVILDEDQVWMIVYFMLQCICIINDFSLVGRSFRKAWLVLQG